MNLEVSRCFADLIYESDEKALQDNYKGLQAWLKRQNYQTALSLGFEDGVELFPLYHDYGLTKLTGVDIEPTAILLKRINSESSVASPILSFFDFYDKELTTDSECKPKLESEGKFNNVFNLIPNTRSLDFLRNQESGFNLIIMSNVLHFEQKFEDVIEILQLARNLLNPNGAFYFRVKEKPGKMRYREKGFGFESYIELFKSYFGHLGGYLTSHKEDEHKEGRAMTFTNIGRIE